MQKHVNCNQELNVRQVHVVIIANIKQNQHSVEELLMIAIYQNIVVETLSSVHRMLSSKTHYNVLIVLVTAIMAPV